MRCAQVLLALWFLKFYLSLEKKQKNGISDGMTKLIEEKSDRTFRLNDENSPIIK